MAKEAELAEAFAAGMAVVALEDAFIDLVGMLLRDGTARRVEVEALRHLHVARFDVVQDAESGPSPTPERSKSGDSALK